MFWRQQKQSNRDNVSEKTPKLTSFYGSLNLKSLKTYKEIHKNPTVLGLVVIAVIVLFGLVNVVGYYKDFQHCLKLENQAKDEKLGNVQIECDLGLTNRFLYLFSSHKINVRAEEGLAEARDEVERMIAEEKVKQKFLKEKLEILGVDFSGNADPNDFQGLEKLEKEKRLTVELKVILEKNGRQPQDQLDRIQGWLQQFNSLNLKKYNSRIQEFEGLSREQIIYDYSKIQALESEVKSEIQTQYFAKYPNSTIGEADLFRFDYSSPSGFKEIFDDTKGSYKNTSNRRSEVKITGNQAVDEHIFKLGEGRGYASTPQADESQLVGDESLRLQPQVLEAWKKMQVAAQSEGVDLGLVSGYRSVSRQKELFWGRFQAGSRQDYSNSDILSGKADVDLDETMQGTAPPGYSRHHTGYTIDIYDVNEANFLEFKDTPGYEWISANNYLNARRFGFVPSYPEGLEKMGPNPEAWEYVWVGIEN